MAGVMMMRKREGGKGCYNVNVFHWNDHLLFPSTNIMLKKLLLSLLAYPRYLFHCKSFGDQSWNDENTDSFDYLIIIKFPMYYQDHITKHKGYLEYLKWIC